MIVLSICHHNDLMTLLLQLELILVLVIGMQENSQADELLGVDNIVIEMMVVPIMEVGKVIIQMDQVQYVIQILV